MELEEILEDAKKILSKERYIHCLGTMERAEELAKIYNEDIEKAKKVGIAHDIAKEMSKEESLKYIKESNIIIDDIERKTPYLLHGKIGADISKKKYGFDKKMQEAILYHTTGNPKMDLFAKIIFVADKTEKNRIKENINIDYEKDMSNKDIDKAMVYILEESIKKNINKKVLIHPDSLLTRNQLIIT